MGLARVWVKEVDVCVRPSLEIILRLPCILDAEVAAMTLDMLHVLHKAGTVCILVPGFQYQTLAEGQSIHALTGHSMALHTQGSP